MSFIADAMLGRLARWLRLLGYDTYYRKDITDRELIRIARQEQRIILTRDRELLKRLQGCKCIFITSEILKEQLGEVLYLFIEKGSEEPQPFSRCTLCNTPIEPVAKQGLSGLVPDHVYFKYSEFARCPACGRIYWRGSHEKKIKELLREII